MVDAHFGDGGAGEGAVDDGGVDAGFFEDGAVLEDAGCAASTVRTCPSVGAELVSGGWIDVFEGGDDGGLVGFDELFHAEAHWRGGSYAAFALGGRVSLGD